MSHHDLSLSDEGKALEKTPRRIDLSTVLMVFFVGISCGALIPVGMKFFGVWNKPSASVAKESEARTSDAPKPGKLQSRLKRVVEEKVTLEKDKDEGAIEAPAPKAVAQPREMALAAKDQKPKGRPDSSVPRASSNKEAASVPAAPSSPAPLPASVSSVRPKDKDKKAEKGVILEEMSSGPSAIEIQDLTLAYTAAKEGPGAPKKDEPNTISTPAKVVVAPSSKPQPAVVPESFAKSQPAQLVTLSAKSPAPQAKLGMLTAVSSAETGSKAAEQTQKVVAMVVNNASYNRASLANCQKRCLLLGLDAFGMPIKAIIDGAVYGEALKQHSGTINLAGQPRLVKNQQVLIVESITFNLGPKLSKGSDASVHPAAKNAVPSDPDDPRPGSVMQERQ